MTIGHSGDLYTWSVWHQYDLVLCFSVECSRIPQMPSPSSGKVRMASTSSLPQDDIVRVKQPSKCSTSYPLHKSQPNRVQRSQCDCPCTPQEQILLNLLLPHVPPQLNSPLPQHRDQKRNILCLRELSPKTRPTAVGETEEGPAHLARLVRGDDFLGLLSRGGRATCPAGRVEGVGRRPDAWVVVRCCCVHVDAATCGENVWYGTVRCLCGRG